MWWFRALAPLLLVAACGFQPAHMSGFALRGQVQVAAPDTRDSFVLVQRLEERLGRTSNATYELGLTLSVEEQGLAINAEGDVRRFNLIGKAEYALRNTQTGEISLSGQVNNFTGYSATGTTVATLAAERDARERLMTILADEIVLRLQSARAQ